MPVMRSFSPGCAARRVRRAAPAASAGAKWKSSSGPSTGTCPMGMRGILDPEAAERQPRRVPDSSVGMMALALTMVLLAVPAAALELDAARLVDLTHPFDANTIYW